MKKAIASLFILSLMISSCQEDELTVTINQTGHVNIKVVDNNKNPIENANVFFSYGSGANISEGISDANGNYVGKLLQGSYYCFSTVIKGNVTYISEAKIVQAFAGESNSYEINPYSNIGNVSLTFRDYYGQTTIPGLNVALVEESVAYFENIEIGNIAEKAQFIGKISNDKTVLFSDVPASQYYIIFIYDANKFYSSISQNSVRVYKNSTTTANITIYE